MESKIEQVVSEHAIQLALLSQSMRNIEGYMKESLESQKKQEVLMEKLANFEETNGNDHKHIHHRIDLLSSRCKDIEDTHQLKCELLQPRIENGAMAYAVIKWFGIAFGAMLLGTLYHNIWGD